MSKSESTALLAKKRYISYLVSWIKKELELSHKKGVVVGISGGVDSAVVGLLAKEACGRNTEFVSLPIGEMGQDLEDAKELANLCGLDLKVCDLTQSFEALKEVVSLKNKLAIINIKPRIRMTFLYALAQERDYLVLGTDNLAEFFLGYYTKFGDGACDLLPLARLTKQDVWEFAKILGVPDSIINKAPTAALFENQSDERELGFTYKDFEDYFFGRKLEAEIVQKISRQIVVTKHKRIMAKKPKVFHKNETLFQKKIKKMGGL